MKPGLRHQKRWARQLSPQTAFMPERGTWRALQDFTVPLIERHASRAHREGLRLLGLTEARPPSLEELAARLHTVDWRLAPAQGEVEPARFFELLAARAFPAVTRLRPIDEVFCGSRPDLWHEVTGHLAAYTDPHVGRFVEDCARLIGELARSSETEAFHRLQKILWVTLEYGFLLEKGEPRAFGAALSGSYMALQRFERGHWGLRPFHPTDVLSSGLYDDDREPRRDGQGRIEMFVLSSFAETLEMCRREIGA